MSNSAVTRCGDDALKLVADYWVLRIVEVLAAADAPLRFAALQRALGDVSPVTLTGRLRRLCERQLVTRAEGSEGRSSVSYQLSDRGRAIVPVIQAISDFAGQG